MEEKNKNEPLVTAVLVCWNHERFVRASVLSALQQTYPSIQLIVFDNGSTDCSRRMLETLRQEYEFTLVCQENIGLVRSLNKGLRMAKGKYFTGLSTDDIWLPDKVARQVSYFEEHQDVHMLGGFIKAIDENGEFITFHWNPKRIGAMCFSDLMTQGNTLLGPTVMCRTSTLRAVNGYDEAIRIEDYALALQFAYEGYGIIVLEETYTLYRRHASNWTSKSMNPEVLEIGHKYKHLPEYKEFLRCNTPRLFRNLVAEGHKMTALRVLLTEPIDWTWDDVGIGMIMFIVPTFLLRWRRRIKHRSN
jgi:glycosyltransferase involved in cell wall biosynthesis